MSFVIGLILGLVIGATVTYFLMSRKTSTQSARIQDLKRQLDLAESEHERRLREATTRLQKDYDAQLRAAQAQVPPPSPPVSSPVAPAPVVESPIAPLPQSPPPAPEPEVAPPPVTATAPAPIPQPVTQSPDIPKETSTRKVPGTAKPGPVSDPNTLLAASYASDAATRCEVADAIANILPTADASAQARWFPVLGRLARDADSKVRLHAVQALSLLKSSKRLPLLRQALRDTDPAVVQAASDQLNHVKRSSARPAPRKRRLPKNQ